MKVTINRLPDGRLRLGFKGVPDQGTVLATLRKEEVVLLARMLRGAAETGVEVVSVEI